jgi:hypothetical protein
MIMLQISLVRHRLPVLVKVPHGVPEHDLSLNVVDDFLLIEAYVPLEDRRSEAELEASLLLHELRVGTVVDGSSSKPALHSAA